MIVERSNVAALVVSTVSSILACVIAATSDTTFPLLLAPIAGVLAGLTYLAHHKANENERNVRAQTEHQEHTR